jgi:polyhydroxyalkanoate synthesis repressor PhaR
MAPPVVIKKYGNRRLYDTDASRYITMDELADKIRGGAEVRVVEAKTGEDLTQATLTQIIVESRGASKLLPVSLLTQMIRMGDDALAEFLGQYMTGAMDLYLRARRGAQAVAPYNPFATLPFQATDALARLFAAPMQAWGVPAEPAPESAADDVAALRREIEDLKQAVQRKPRKRAKTGR